MNSCITPITRPFYKRGKLRSKATQLLRRGLWGKAMLNTKAGLADGRFRAPLSLTWPARLPTPQYRASEIHTHSSSLSRTSRGTGNRDRRQAWLMCWISPSRCWCWAPDMWSWNSFNTKEQGTGMRRGESPGMAVRAGPTEEVSNLSCMATPPPL